MKKEIKRRPITRYIKLWPTLMIISVLILACLTSIWALTPRRYELGVGSVAEEEIKAPRAIEDTTATRVLREKARASVPAVCAIDQTAAAEYYSDAKKFFEAIKLIRSKADELKTAAGNTAASLSASKWAALLSDQDEQTLMAMTSPTLASGELYAVLEASEASLDELSNTVLGKLQQVLANGLSESSLAAVREAAGGELDGSSLSAGLKSVGKTAFSAFMLPTYLEDEAATENARLSAANAVEPVMMKRGEVIVSKGDVVTQEQLAILETLNLVRPKSTDLMLNLGIIIYLCCVFGFFYLYMLYCMRHVIENLKSMLIISLTIAIAVLVEVLLCKVSATVTPGLIAVMLVAVLVGERPALAVTMMTAFVIGLFASGKSGTLMQFDTVVMFASSIAGGVAAVFTLRHAQRRSVMITAGVSGAVASALVVSGIYIMSNASVLSILEAAGWAAGGNILASVFVVGTLSVWENVFDIATAPRLTELSNVNHPLLKQLMTEAPGTYHHSIMTAALAEAAASRIGANTLLSRVGAYYHDVGKLRRPLYFAENQKNGVNIHDTLPALESASIIISHEKDGLILLNKYKLPSAIKQIEAEHHGTTLVTYFYHKAMEDEDGASVNQKAFRYPGGKPSSRESAIVMLADSCEAAVRSMGDTTVEEIENMVHKVIWGKLNDGQMVYSQLSLTDINEIEKSFVKALVSIAHERIEYPEFNEKTDVANDRSDL